MGGSLTGFLRGPPAVLSASLLYALLLERVRFAHVVRTFGAAEEPWWFGYARDGVTLAALASFVAAYRSVGYSYAAALLVGGLVLL